MVDATQSRGELVLDDVVGRDVRIAKLEVEAPARVEEIVRPPSGIFKIKGCSNKGELDDSVSRIVERAALGKGNYDRKVFNNIWGTFTFGPDNTVYLGAYRGFLRFWSDDDMP